MKEIIKDIAFMVDVARNKLNKDLKDGNNEAYFNLLTCDNLDELTTPTMAKIIRKDKKVYLEQWGKRTKKEVVDPKKILGQMSFSFTLDM